MLTGQRAFEGDDVADTLAAVLRADPDWAALPAETPPAIRTLLRSCLERDRRRRLADVAGGLFVLDHGAQLVEAAPTVIPPGRTKAGRSVRPLWRRAAPVTAAAVISLVLGGAAVWWWTRPLPLAPVRTMITAPESAALVMSGADRDIAVPPDGSRVVYRGNNQLVVRALDQLEPTVLSGLGAPRGAFIAPDGQWVGFFDGTTTLKKVAIRGGPAITLCGLTGTSRGATWGDDGTVIFATSDQATGLQRVSAAGGSPTVLTKPDRERGELDHVFPEFLPGADAVLFTIAPSGPVENAQIAVLDLRTNTQKVLVRGGRSAHYVPTGHLVFEAAGTLQAVAFDLARLEVTGSAVPIVENVAFTGLGARNAVVTANGMLVYVSGTSAGGPEQLTSSLVWVARDGAASPLKVREAAYGEPRISPDGSRVAVAMISQGNQDIWVMDVARGTHRRGSPRNAALRSTRYGRRTGSASRLRRVGRGRRVRSTGWRQMAAAPRKS